MERTATMKREREFALYDISTDPRGVPRYSIREVALFVHLPEKTLRTWVAGRTFPRVAGEGHSTRLIEPADGEGSVLSFYNLIEAHILRSTRKRDEVPMKFIRDAIDFVNERYPARHPLITGEFETDGRHLFVRKLEGLLNASLKGQIALEPILDEYLKRIDRDTQRRPIAVYPIIPRKPNSRAVTIKYGVSSGAPVLSGTGILVSALWHRFKAGDSIRDLAEDYDQPMQNIEEAIAYLDAA